MTLRRTLILYLIFVHLIFAGIAVAVLLERRLWLLAVEVVLAASVF